MSRTVVAAGAVGLFSLLTLLSAVPAGAGFDVVLRTYTSDTTGPNLAFLRLDADEAYGDYYWRLDAADSALAEAALGQVTVRRVGTSDVICSGDMGEVVEVHVHQVCDGLRVQHHYEVEWTAYPAGAVLTLRGY